MKRRAPNSKDPLEMKEKDVEKSLPPSSAPEDGSEVATLADEETQAVGGVADASRKPIELDLDQGAQVTSSRQ